MLVNTRISSCEFHDAMNANPFSSFSSFSYEALEALYELLNEDDEQIELDPIAIRSQFSEESLEDFANDFDIEPTREAIEQYLEDEGAWFKIIGGNVVFNADAL